MNGAVVNVRGKGDKLAVWLADASQPDSILRIGKMIKERLNIDPDIQIGFNIHNEEKSRPGSSVKKRGFYVWEQHLLSVITSIETLFDWIEPSEGNI